MAKFFTMTNGKSIDFVSGYKNSHIKTNSSVKHKNVSYHAFLEKVKKNIKYIYSDQLAYRGFYKDIGVFCLVLDTLSKINLLKPYGRGLDIGGAEGGFARFLRGAGVVKHVTCNDYNDLSYRLPKSLYIKYLLKFYVARFFNGKLPKFRIPDLEINFGPTINNQTLKSQNFFKSGIIDDFVVGDFMSFEANGQKYDFISSVLCMNHFNSKEKMSRVSELLEDDGVFFMIASNFWWIVNVTEIIGDFPYAQQRLTRDELQDYFIQNHPDEAKDVIERYDYFHKSDHKPTLNDYIEDAKENGLTLVHAEYLIPTSSEHSKTPFPPQTMEKQGELDMLEVLEDVQRHRPDVRLLDLQAPYLIAVFRKS